MICAFILVSVALTTAAFAASFNVYVPGYGAGSTTAAVNKDFSGNANSRVSSYGGQIQSGTFRVYESTSAVSSQVSWATGQEKSIAYYSGSGIVSHDYKLKVYSNSLEPNTSSLASGTFTP